MSLEGGDTVFPVPDARHPETGRRYIHVIDAEDPSLKDICTALEFTTRTAPWLGVVPMRTCISERDVWMQEDLSFTFWRELPPKVAMGVRKAKIALHYCEPYPSELFKKTASLGYYDIVFAHTEKVRARLSEFHMNTVVTRTGYCPQTMGTPAWSSPKPFDIVSYGNLSERRARVVNQLRSHFGDRFVHFADRDGLDRKRMIESGKLLLYIAQNAHDDAFSPMRIWQAAATSTPLFAEPLEGIEMIGVIPWFDEWSAAIHAIEGLLADREWLVERAEMTHRYGMGNLFRSWLEMNHAKMEGV